MLAMAPCWWKNGLMRTFLEVRDLSSIYLEPMKMSSETNLGEE